MIDEFVEAIEAARNGEIGESELFERVFGIVSEMNRGLSEELCRLLAQGLIEGVDTEEWTWNIEIIGEHLPGGTYTLPDQSTLELDPLDEEE